MLEDVPYHTKLPLENTDAPSAMGSIISLYVKGNPRNLLPEMQKANIATNIPTHCRCCRHDKDRDWHPPAISDGYISNDLFSRIPFHGTCPTLMHIRGQGIFANIGCCSMSHKFRLVKLCGTCRGEKVLKMIVQMRGQVTATCFRYTYPQHIPSIAKKVIILPLNVYETDPASSFCV